jgi:molybdopterin/thiamine biosynthesis adenylyltransferase
VRVAGDTLAVSFNDDLRPPSASTSTQIRTVSAWGEHLHRDISRLRVLIVGVGSVGLEVALRLAATGIAEIGLMDFDRVEALNLDRLVGATPIDAVLRRHKVPVAARLLRRSATAERFTVHEHIVSICEPDGLAIALDYDVIISCVDRPWPRGILNTIAYSDVIPIIDGGIHIDAFPDGGMRGAAWRAHVLRPGRPCLVCNGQLNPAMVPLDREGLLDDPTYIAQSGITARSRQNVAALSASVSSSILALFVSLVAGPGGLGEPGPLRYHLATHTLDVLDCTSGANCPFEAAVAVGDGRPVLTAKHPTAAAARAPYRLSVRLRVLAAASATVERAHRWLEAQARSGFGRDHRPGDVEVRTDPRGGGANDEHRTEK